MNKRNAWDSRGGAGGVADIAGQKQRIDPIGDRLRELVQGALLLRIAAQAGQDSVAGLQQSANLALRKWAVTSRPDESRIWALGGPVGLVGGGVSGTPILARIRYWDWPTTNGICPARRTGALELARAELDVRQDVYTQDALAWALFRNGKVEEAAAAIEKALSQNSPEPAFHEHAAQIFEAMGRTGEAKLHREQSRSGFWQ